MSRTAIAVVGSGDTPLSTAAVQLAFEVGSEIAIVGAVLICGGRRGIMQAAAEGARSHGGMTIGILPGYDRADANPAIEYVIATGMGQARNVIIVASADAVIALEGEGGTLSEIGLALKLGRPVVAVRAWRELATIAHAEDPREAVERALQLTGRAPSR